MYGDRHTFCDLGGAICGLDQHISALRTECGGNSACERLDTIEESSSALDAKLQLLVGKSLLHERARAYP